MRVSDTWLSDNNGGTFLATCLVGYTCLGHLTFEYLSAVLTGSKKTKHKKKRRKKKREEREMHQGLDFVLFNEDEDEEVLV